MHNCRLYGGYRRQLQEGRNVTVAKELYHTRKNSVKSAFSLMFLRAIVVYIVYVESRVFRCKLKPLCEMIQVIAYEYDSAELMKWLKGTVTPFYIDATYESAPWFVKLLVRYMNFIDAHIFFHKWNWFCNLSWDFALWKDANKLWRLKDTSNTGGEDGIS